MKRVSGNWRHLILSFTLSLSAIGSAAALTGCDTITGSGEAARDERQLEPFDSVVIDAGLVAEVTVGPQQVVVSGDDNIVPWVQTVVRNRVLEIDPVHDFHTRVPLRITVQAPAWRVITSDAGSSVAVDVGRDLDPEAPLKLRSLAGSELVAEGEVGALSAELQAGGTLDCQELVAEQVSIHASGGGVVSVTAEDAVEGSISGGSVGHVFGAPAERDVRTSGGGVVRFEP